MKSCLMGVFEGVWRFPAYNRLSDNLKPQDGYFYCGILYLELQSSRPNRRLPCHPCFLSDGLH